MMRAHAQYADMTATMRARVHRRHAQYLFAGTVKSTKMIRTITVRRNYLHFIKKYQR